MVRLAVYDAVLRTGPISILVFLSTLGMTVFETARVPVLEDAICHALASDDCREDHLAQARLATINSWIEIVTSVQGIILSLPYAWIAERMSKYRLLFISVTASITSMAYFLFISHAAAKSTLHLDLVLLFRVIESIGGGLPVAHVLLSALLARQTTSETRASVFYLVSTLSVLGRAGGTSLCGVILDNNAGAGILTAMIIYALNLPVIAIFGRDVDRTEVVDDYQESSAVLCHRLIPSPDACEHVVRDSDSGGSDNDIATKTVDNTGSVATTTGPPLLRYRSLLSKPIIARGLLFYVVKVLAEDVQMLQAQWLVRRFAWTFSAAAYVNAYIALLCLITLASLPILTTHLAARYNGHTQKMEITILRMSVAAFTLSSLGIGLSPNRGVYILTVSFAALSVGSFDTFKSLLSGFCTADLMTELYATINLVETAVHIVATRMWTLILIKSFDQEGVLKGLPYLVSSGLGLFAFCLIWYMAGCTDAYQPVNTTEDLRGNNSDDTAL